MTDRRLPELLIVLNFFDAVVTFFLIRKGMIEEANPLMNVLIQFNPLTFLIFKVITVTALVVMLAHVHAKKSLVILTVIYGALALYHLRSLFLLAGV